MHMLQVEEVITKSEKTYMKLVFDFYAGSDFLQPQDKKNPQAANLYSLADQYGYTIARGYKDYLRKSKKADKMILFQPEAASKADRSSIHTLLTGEKVTLLCRRLLVRQLISSLKIYQKGSS